MLSQEYLNNPRMSQSKLKKILDGVEEFKWHLDNPTETTDAMKLGIAVHLLLLQPEFSNKVVVVEKFDRRTKDGKESYTQQQKYIETNPDCIFLDSEQIERAYSIDYSVRKNTDAMQILSCCESFEQEHYFEYSGINFKAQTDGVGSDFVLDVKTTRCENNDYKIKNEIIGHKYHLQAALYLQATKKTNYYIIFVRTEPPYAVFPVKLSDELLDQGKLLLDTACDIYKDCLKNNPTFKPDNKVRVI